MAVKLNELLEACPDVRLTLIAGDAGLPSPVSWVHVLESPQLTGYLHGGELVLSTGVVLSDEDAEVDFIARLQEQGVVAVALDEGSCLDGIPQQAKRYCDDHGMPLFAIAKDASFESIVKPLCNYIVNDNAKEHLISAALKSAIFFPERHDLYLVQLSELHFQTEWRYAVCVIKLLEVTGDPFVRSESIADSLRSYLHRQVSVSAVVESDQEILAVIHCDDEGELHTVAGNAKAFVGRQLRNGEKMAIGVGKLTKSLRCLYKSYHQAEAIMRIQTKQSMLDAGYIYSDMGAYRLLLGIEDSDIVADYLNQVLGPLIDYDTQKGSDFTKVLRVYLFNNGSVQETASQLYVHRNTVNYRINRASEILGMDLSNLEVRLQLMLCFLLLDMR